MKGRLRQYTYPVLFIICPECGHRANLTTWRPGNGFDIGMRQYHCKVCRSDYYLIFVDLDALAVVDRQCFLQSAAD